MTEISPDVQALIDQALAEQRAQLTAPAPAPVLAVPSPAPAEPVQIRHTAASAAAVGKADAFAEAQLEALKRPLQVQFRDLTFDIPPADAWLVDFTDLMQNSALKAALILAVGEDNYSAFRALDPAPGMIDHLALANRISEAVRAGDS